MTLSIECHANGPLRQNCYVVGNGAGEALIVDPGSDADGIAGMLERHELQPRAIINTHGHFDHICAVADLMARFEVPFYLHGGDGETCCAAQIFTPWRLGRANRSLSRKYRLICKTYRRHFRSARSRSIGPKRLVIPHNAGFVSSLRIRFSPAIRFLRARLAR